MRKTKQVLESMDSKQKVVVDTIKEEKKSNKSSQDVDVYAGQQLRVLRKLHGVSQKSLAELAGTTFQQIQKYEKGINRMSLGRIYVFCKVFAVQPGYFFYDNLSKPSSKGGYILSEKNKDIEGVADIIGLYKKISEPAKVKIAKELLKYLAK